MSKYVECLEPLGEVRTNTIHIRDDMESGDHVVLVNNVSQKVAFNVYTHIDPVEVMTRRVESQHTMNCLSMQALDFTAPFNSMKTLSDLTPAEEHVFQDSVQAVYDAHHKLSVGGYYLWSSKIVMTSNALMVLNCYVSKADIKESEFLDKLPATMLEAHITSADLSKCFDTFKHPGLYWEVKLDVSSPCIVMARRIDPLCNFKPDVVMSTTLSEDTCNRRAIEEVPQNAIMDAFNIHTVTGKQQYSNPGQVNTVRTYRCVDEWANHFILQLAYNL